MVRITLDEALPVVQDLAWRKANAFVHRCGFSIDEREDVESQLLLTFLIRWSKFDCGKASVRTFASRVMDMELTSILRYRLAEGRQPQELPEACVSPSPAALRQFHIDLDRAIAPLPRSVQEAVAVVSCSSTVEAAAKLGCTRQMVNKRKRLIRQAMLAAGIGPDYFARSGGAQ